RLQIVEFGVRGGKVEIPEVVLHTVAPEVQEQEVVPNCPGEERSDGSAEPVLGFVDQHDDVVELSNVGVSENACEFGGVLTRCTKLLELAVSVLRGGYDEC